MDGTSRSETAAAALDDLRWRHFQQHQTHSLRIPVSRVAACTGFHPYQDLVKLFLMEHVYQGYGGQCLLQHDAKLLGLVLETEEEQVRQIAKKAGQKTEQALKEAMSQKAKDNVEAAQQVKSKVLTEAKKSKRLNKDQLVLLDEAARHNVFTNFGTQWEDAALDLYEQQIGCQVRQRNSELKIWPFEQLGNDTVRPMSQSYSVGFDDEALGPAVKRTKTEVVDLVDSDDDEDNGNSRSVVQSEPIRPNHPFFTLRGAVDGIRDELVSIGSRKEERIAQGEDDDDDSWVFQQVVVECKHRMQKMQSSPPIYEMIQTVSYCLMFQVKDADLIQVLRKAKPTEPKTKPKSSNVAASQPVSSLADQNSSDSTAAKKPSENKLSPPQPTASASEKEKGRKGRDQEDASIEIKVSRIRVNDPFHKHGENWEHVILPRLRSWVEAVYRVRQDDGRRYAFLTAIASTSPLDPKGWNLLFDECPWLKHCDTQLRHGQHES